MFSPMHLYILGFCAALIAGVTVWTIRRKVPLKTMLSVMVGVTIFGELMKIFARMEVVDGAARLSVEFLPLHLCSMQIVLFWYLRFFNRSPEREKTLLAFMYPTTLIGGLAALLIATVDPIALSNADIYEYFIYHAMVVAFGIYIVATKQVDLTWKRFWKTALILVILFYLSIYTNAMFSQGAFKANFFYSAEPPLPGLPYLNFGFFGQELPGILGWIWYLAKMVFLGVVAVLGCYAPFLFRRKAHPHTAS